jgi:hypothetical protein
MKDANATRQLQIMTLAEKMNKGIKVTRRLVDPRKETKRTCNM